MEDSFCKKPFNQERAKDVETLSRFVSFVILDLKSLHRFLFTEQESKGNGML